MEGRWTLDSVGQRARLCPTARDIAVVVLQAAGKVPDGRQF
jgi:hypothetical protein